MLKTGGKDDNEFLSVFGGNLADPLPDGGSRPKGDTGSAGGGAASAGTGGSDHATPQLLAHSAGVLGGQAHPAPRTSGVPNFTPQQMFGGGTTVVMTSLSFDGISIAPQVQAATLDTTSSASTFSISIDSVAPTTDPAVTTDAAPQVAAFSVAAPVVAELTTTPALNKIALENLKQGTPRSVWALQSDIGDANIQGFATEISTNIGGTVDFKIATDSTHYRLEIYRMGYYGGDGARLVDVVDKQLDSAQIQPHPIVDASIGLIDAGNWSVSASWDIPADAVSGVYFAKLVREDGTAGENIIPFIVRDDSAHSDIVFQTSDTTWQAYNPWGGANLYGGTTPLNPNDMIAYMPPNCGCGLGAIGRAYAVSYNRPIITSTNTGFLLAGPQDFVFGEEFPAIQWLEQNGYDVTYISGVDAARSGSLLLNHDVYLSVGHDEYWSAEQRENVTAARDAGVNLAFLGGNDCYWKVQWTDSIDGNGTPYRTMVCYKDTWANTQINPADSATGTWRDPRFADPGQEPENSLLGTMFTVDSWRSDTMTIPYDMTQLRFWRNTAISDTQPGDTAELVNGLLGYEWNSDVDNGFRPAGLINLSLSTISVDTYLLDYGNTVGSGTATHSLTMYRDQESGALVFSAGSVMWSWGLNAQHDLEGVPVDPNVQQAMVNLFADMGVQPTTLDASLVLATQSTDTLAPVAALTNPTAGAAFTEGQRFTITGTAQDLGGGRVAGIEVSVDGGITWHKATGTTNWSYVWIAQASGTYQITARATDDSLNIGAGSANVSIQVTLPSTSSLWTYADAPAQLVEYERDSVELGVKFTAETAGTISAIRFYKGPLNGGTHTGSLWTSSGTLLATGTFTDETLTGWQTLTFSNPITVQAGQQYVASYHTSGYYSADEGYFNASYDSGVLSASAGAGAFAYGSDAYLFPSLSSNSNYWVDVVFTPSTTNNAPTAFDDTVRAGWNATAEYRAAQLLGNDTDPDGDALRILSVSNAVHGVVSFNATTKIVSFTPDSGFSGTASFSYSITDGRGGTANGNVTVEVLQGVVGASLFSLETAPTGTPQNDSAGVELGVKFTVAADGTITGLRYYKSAQDTGTHTGSLWTSTGVLLATATFTNETESGWQTVTFANAISVSANVTYVASYHSNGFYMADGNYFATNVVNGPVMAPSSTAAGGNGVYAYGSTSVFPSDSFGATNYWVDVTFDSLGGGNHNPVAGADTGYSTPMGTPITIAVASLLANDSDADGDALTITAVSAANNGTVSLDAVNGTITYTPNAGFSGAGGFSYTLSDGQGGSATGAVSVAVTSSSTTYSLFGSSDQPVNGSVYDPNSVELGVKFTVSADGTITGIKYYKSAQDLGTHTGSLWTSTGTLLATATFTNETASGWQVVTFNAPISVTAGVTYVASFHSNGYYAADGNYFTNDHTSGPLTALSSASSGGNGIYGYGTGTLFPTQTYNSANYWVDVVYTQGSTNHNPVANADSGLTTAAGTPLAISASTLLANDTDADNDPLTITGVSGASNGSVTFDAVNNVVTFTPNVGYSGAATFTYAISDGHGGLSSAEVSLQVAAPVEQSLFSASDAPAQTYSDGIPLQLGMQFQADVAGNITGIRFYKAANDNTTHTANLWTSTGTLLASGTTTDESASGWQTVTLTQPVSITANTDYVVSYGSNGAYGATGNFFTADITNGHLTAASDINGLYAYGTGDIFPTSTYNKTNYYVDVLFQPLAA
ncbi:hypothetical protein GCM10011321_43070 [Youhaiella tibetensis]|uniref:DUF4082 domain-containing protein n=1 Tax=Paradevosia tibetensis TaxID=1447062 RepID=A0A5B9DTM8_9HYPH|nr:DUF4082 domain-containing protein [Youhaiella tibetensis]QEE21808.1 DUF4082 domain-containing protein [Youhaiella tibetensis]GGF48072.1 hypothetical protein GCM10011321_43070 [Youhaiella tibetensis]